MAENKMTKDKQIAEMARIAYGIEVFDESDAKIAVEDGLLDPLLNLHTAGYCKASEIFEEIDVLIVRIMIADSPFIVDRLIRDITKLKKKYIGEDTENRLYCSCCEKECLSKNMYYVYSDYCPNCGAKMDRERKEG